MSSPVWDSWLWTEISPGLAMPVGWVSPLPRLGCGGHLASRKAPSLDHMGRRVFSDG